MNQATDSPHNTLMCGRYTLTVDLDAITAEFGPFETRETIPIPRFNIAPTQSAPVLRNIEGKHWVDALKWGLIPSWSKDATIGTRLINARSETVSEKPSFRAAFKSRRCLIPTTGFYEWRKISPNGPKQPYHIHRKDGRAFAYAGLWEQWTDPNGEVVESFTILTTEANDLIRPLHNRMPVILSPNDYDKWLNAGASDVETLRSLMQPFSGDDFEITPVSKRINSARNDDPECVEPVDPPSPPEEQGSLFS